MFEVPASKASKGQDRFEFSIPGATGKFSVKKLKFLSVGKRDEIGDGGRPMLDFFCEGPAKQGEGVRALDEEQFNALVNAWQADSGVTLGESEASAS
jgi:hypothetical protein